MQGALSLHLALDQRPWRDELVREARPHPRREPDGAEEAAGARQDRRSRVKGVPMRSRSLRPHSRPGGPHEGGCLRRRSGPAEHQWAVRFRVLHRPRLGEGHRGRQPPLGSKGTDASSHGRRGSKHELLCDRHARPIDSRPTLPRKPIGPTGGVAANSARHGSIRTGTGRRIVAAASNRGVPVPGCGQ